MKEKNLIARLISFSKTQNHIFQNLETGSFIVEKLEFKKSDKIVLIFLVDPTASSAKHGLDLFCRLPKQHFAISAETINSKIVHLGRSIRFLIGQNAKKYQLYCLLVQFQTRFSTKLPASIFSKKFQLTVPHKFERIEHGNSRVCRTNSDMSRKLIA